MFELISKNNVNVTLPALQSGNRTAFDTWTLQLKMYQNILNEKQKVYLNYQIMQLYQPNMSLQAQNKVDYVLDNFIPEFNKTDFLKSSILDGFADLNLNELFTTFNRIISDDKSST